MLHTKPAYLSIFTTQHSVLFTVVPRNNSVQPFLYLFRRAQRFASGCRAGGHRGLNRREVQTAPRGTRDATLREALARERGGLKQRGTAYMAP